MIPDLQKGGADVYIKSTDACAIPELYDIPIGMVNRILYLPRESQGPKTS